MIDKGVLEGLLRQAEDHPRKRVNYDMRTSPEDGSQRMLNVMIPGTVVEIHHHPRSDENMIAIWGKMDVILLKEEGARLVETELCHLCPAEGRYGYQVPKGVWHTVEVIEPTVIYEAKDGKYGEDGRESYQR